MVTDSCEVDPDPDHTLKNPDPIIKKKNGFGYDTRKLDKDPQP